MRLDNLKDDDEPEVPTGFGDTVIAPRPDDLADRDDRSPSPLGRRDRFEAEPSTLTREAFDSQATLLTRITLVEDAMTEVGGYK